MLVLQRGQTYTFTRTASFEFGPGAGWHLTGISLPPGIEVNYDSIPSGTSHNGWLVSFAGDSITFTIPLNATLGIYQFDWNTNIMGSGGAQFQFELVGSPGGGSGGGSGSAAPSPENPQEHEIYQRFNTAIIPESAWTPDFESNQRADAPGASARITRQSRPYWKADLSGLTMNDKQKAVAIAQGWRNRSTRPMLVRVTPFCEIGLETGRRSAAQNGKLIVYPQKIGVSSGSEQTFQLVKRLYNPGYDNEHIYYNVTKPEWGYPPLKQIGVTVNGYTDWKPMDDLALWVSATEPVVAPGDDYPNAPWVKLPAHQWEVDRDTGVVTTSVSGVIGATGGFYVLMLVPPLAIGQDPEKRAGLWAIKQGVMIVEPPGEDNPFGF
jgi:stage V sporulation protein SpoVS